MLSILERRWSQQYYFLCNSDHCVVYCNNKQLAVEINCSRRRDAKVIIMKTSRINLLLNAQHSTYRQDSLLLHFRRFHNSKFWSLVIGLWSEDGHWTPTQIYIYTLGHGGIGWLHCFEIEDLAKYQIEDGCTVGQVPSYESKSYLSEEQPWLKFNP